MTKARLLALYTILEVPFSSTHNRIIGDGLVVETHSVTGSPKCAKDIINAYVAEAELDNDMTTVLNALLDAWIALGTDTTAIDAGAVGNVQGITLTIAAEREEIKKQVLIIVPAYRCHEEFERPGASVMVWR